MALGDAADGFRPWARIILGVDNILDNQPVAHRLADFAAAKHQQGSAMLQGWLALGIDPAKIVVLEPQPTRDGTVAAIAPDRREPEASRNRQVTNGLSCTKMLGRCGAVCAANTGRPDCASTVCVRLQQQCLNTGCWNGRAFSSCGLIKQ